MAKELDLGLDERHTTLTREEATKHPCFGGCGKSWKESGGGWFSFESATTLRPRWLCNECQDRENENESSIKEGTLH